MRPLRFLLVVLAASNSLAAVWDPLFAARVGDSPTSAERCGFEAATALLRANAAANMPIQVVFHHEATRAARGGLPEPLGVQDGTLVVANPDVRRLDIRLEGREDAPIVCALDGRDAWMVWADEPLVIRSGRSISATRSWAGQLRAQVSQTQYWTESLLPATRSRTECWRLLSAVELADESVQFSVAAESRSGPRELLVTARRAAEADPLVISRIVDTGTGGIVEYADYAELEPGTWLPYKITSCCVDEQKRRYTATWYVTDALRLSSEQEAIGLCTSPSAPTDVFPRLFGELLLRPDGSASARLW